MPMPRLRAHNIAVSLDGYMAGPDQSLENPLGASGLRLRDWIFATRTWNLTHGEDPAFHHPVFVLTHHPRPPLTMQGGTTFHFVTGGIEAARERALDAAAGADVRVGGGADTIRQYLRAGLIDELHLAIVPILLGGGERLLDDLGESAGRYRCVELVSSPAVVHVRLARG
jgi:dihydrofolate reductase